jgi:uncharacterized protein CbrC (UPF0167 family)
VPIYSFTGRIVDPSLAKNSALATEEPEVCELCSACILGGNVRKSDYQIREMMPIVTTLAADRARAIEEYHRIPEIPLFLQRDDWPMCCGEWCEFVGVPSSYEESRQVPGRYRYWERGPRGWRSEYELLPESLREISLFRCIVCGGEWFTWQFT